MTLAYNKTVSTAVIRRLPRYHRYLAELLNRDINRISSKELAQRMNLTASQIRQDLNCFGGFGQQGYGYNVRVLYEEIGRILGLNKGLTAVLVGVGNLGHAFAKNIDFQGAGFNLIAAFDKSEELIGTTIAQLKIKGIDEISNYCAQNKVDVAVLCVPSAAAVRVADLLVSCGVNSFWNFTYADIAAGHPNLIVENAHLGDGLMTLCYHINDAKNKENENS